MSVAVRCCHCSPPAPFLKWWWNSSLSTEHQHHVRALHLGQYQPFKCDLPDCKQSFTLEAFFDSHSERKHPKSPLKPVVSQSNYLEVLTNTMMQCNNYASNDNANLACKMLESMEPQTRGHRNSKVAGTPATDKRAKSVEVIELGDGPIESPLPRKSTNQCNKTAISLTQATPVDSGEDPEIYIIEPRPRNLCKASKSRSPVSVKDPNKCKNRKSKASVLKMSRIGSSSSFRIKRKRNWCRFPCCNNSPKRFSFTKNSCRLSGNKRRRKPKEIISKARKGAVRCKMCGILCDTQRDHIWLYHTNQDRFECSKCGVGFGPGERGRVVSHIVREHGSRARVIDNGDECCNYQRLYNRCFPAVV